MAEASSKGLVFVSCGQVTPEERKLGADVSKPGQAPTRQPEYELTFEITPELRPFVERYFNEMQ